MTILRFPPHSEERIFSLCLDQGYNFFFLFVHNNTQHHADTPLSLEGEEEEAAYLLFIASPSSGSQHLPTLGATYSQQELWSVWLFFYGIFGFGFWFWLVGT